MANVVKLISFDTAGIYKYFISLFLICFLSSTAYAQQCEDMLTHAVRLTEETESTSQSLDDKYFNHCSKEYLEESITEGETKTGGVSYGGFGVDAGKSETSSQLEIRLNQQCRLDDIDKRSSGKYRAFLQKLQPEYFQAYSQCLSAQGDLIFSVTSGSTSKQVNVIFKSRHKDPINIISAEVVGDKNIRCTEAVSKEKLSELTFPITLEKNQLAMNCIHEPKSKDGDLYTYGAGTLFINADSKQNTQTKVLFPGSKSVVGKSLSQLEANDFSLNARIENFAKASANEEKRLATLLANSNGKIQSLEETRVSACRVCVVSSKGGQCYPKDKTYCSEYATINGELKSTAWVKDDTDDGGGSCSYKTQIQCK